MENPPEPTRTVIASLQKFVTTAQLLQALAAFLIGCVVAALSVYNHFAKSSEVAELACKVAEQDEINNEMIASSQEIQKSLKLLKQNFSASKDKPISAAFMAEQIAAAVDKIEKSLENINKTRQTGKRKLILKDGKC